MNFNQHFHELSFFIVQKQCNSIQFSAPFYGFLGCFRHINYEYQYKILLIYPPFRISFVRLQFWPYCGHTTHTIMARQTIQYEYSCRSWFHIHSFRMDVSLRYMYRYLLIFVIITIKVRTNICSLDYSFKWSP